MNGAKGVITAVCLWAFSASAAAHVSEQGFVLLLPTKAYIAGGVLAVALTVVLLGFVSDQQSRRLFVPRLLFNTRLSQRWQTLSSLLCLGILSALIVIGFTGSRDPLSNPFPLTIWTLWWIGFVSVQGLVGNLWHWVNPWVGLHRLIRSQADSARFSLPDRLGVWPGAILFLGFSAFALAYPSPDDPARLAVVVSGYFLITLAGLYAFGSAAWLGRVECFSILLNHYARLAPICGTVLQRRLDTEPEGVSGSQIDDGHGVKLGMPGWAAREHADRLYDDARIGNGSLASVGVFVLVVLACGSFDGLNETFWWLSVINVNPLEFPGRSAVVMETLVGLLVANAGLILIFAVCVGTGLWLSTRYAATNQVAFLRAFGVLAIGILPIALAYHIAHFLTAFLVNVQYALAAFSDPLHSGADWLGLGTFYVTTGFFNTHHTVHIIWLIQAGTVVTGHVLSVLLTHAIAVKLLGTGRGAVISQLPLALFMILYTLLGLWLLASPRGA